MRAVVAVVAVWGLSLAALAAPARAAPPPPSPRSVSLREAIAYARAHQPSLAAAQARVAVARAQAELPRAARRPRIVAGAELLVGTNNNTTASFGGPLGFDVPRIGGTPANAPVSLAPEPTTLVGAGLRQELYDFGRLSAQADALDLLARAADDDAQRVALDLTLLVEDSFYAVAGAHAVVRAAEAAVARATAHRELASAGVTARLRPPIELTRAAADLARFEVDRVRAQGALLASQAVLAAAIGAPDAALDAGADDVRYPDSPSFADAGRAIDQREPAIRAAAAQLAAQRALTTAIERELRPDLGLSASVTARAGGSEVATNPTPTGGGWLPDVANWDAVVVLSWPIFDRTIDVRAETSRRLERVRAAELDGVREQLRGRATAAYVELDVASTAVPALERALDAARANQAQADARYASGLATAVELADAEALLADAEIQLAIGQFQRARARARLARVLAEVVP
jgi:outer membrane protein TolC